MNQYTKGEWKIVEEPQGINQTPRTDIMAFQDGYERNICQLSIRAPEEELANAQLIAASPSIYEALKDAKSALVAFGGKYTDHIAMRLLKKAATKMDEALAKAEGKD